MHGYALRVELTFVGKELDERNWLVDFGSLKSFKGTLEDLLDHKTLMAEDDPELETFKHLERRGLIQLRVLPSVGCEALAYWIFQAADVWLHDNGYAPRVRLQKVQVNEHEGNYARYEVND